jgi:hypothetical protein
LILHGLIMRLNRNKMDLKERLKSSERRAKALKKLIDEILKIGDDKLETALTEFLIADNENMSSLLDNLSR